MPSKQEDKLSLIVNQFQTDLGLLAKVIIHKWSKNERAFVGAGFNPPTPNPQIHIPVEQVFNLTLARLDKGEQLFYNGNYLTTTVLIVKDICENTADKDDYDDFSDISTQFSQKSVLYLQHFVQYL